MTIEKYPMKYPYYLHRLEFLFSNLEYLTGICEPNEPVNKPLMLIVWERALGDMRMRSRLS
jgi:hypothetical protein